MKVLKKIFKVFEWVVFLLLLIILFLVSSPLLPTKNYISTHVVSTGSMEPSIMTGSVVFSKLKEVNIGDTIVFTSPNDKEVNIVHRVVDINNGEYITKGDNNKDIDSWVVYENDIKGKVLLTIPKLGYGIEYLKTPKGFALLLGIPALLLILSMLKNIKEGITDEVEKRVKEEKVKDILSKPDHPRLRTVITILIFSLLMFNGIPHIYALFSSSVQILGITLTVGEIQTMPKVIISEVMWSGSSASENDQWIELYNTTQEDINIGKWRIVNSRDLNKPAIMIPANSIIKSNGYFLISNYSNNSNNSFLNIDVDMVNASMTLLHLNNGNLILKDVEGNTVDQVLGTPNWPKGIQGTTYNSMQRVSNSINGLDINNWYTCLHTDCTSEEFWKLDNTLNYGSPGKENISN